MDVWKREEDKTLQQKDTAAGCGNSRRRRGWQEEGRECSEKD